MLWYILKLYTLNDLLNARGIYLNFLLKGGHLINTRHLLEGGVYFLSKVMHSNHYRRQTNCAIKQ